MLRHEREQLLIIHLDGRALARPNVLVLRGAGEELDELLLYLACTAHVYLVGIQKLGSDLFEVLMSKRDLLIVGRVLVRVLSWAGVNHPYLKLRRVPFLDLLC